MAFVESVNFRSQPGKAHGWLKFISLLTVLSVFALIVLGGVVRVTGSGLGCPDWPLCYGKVLPPLEFTAIIEYTHRLVASAIVGPLILVTCGTVWLAYRREKWLVIPATVAVFLLIAQALLGGVTVLRELPGEIVAAHLALGEALLACLLLVLVVAYRGPLAVRLDSAADSKPDRFPLLAFISATGVYLLIITGSLVTATGATAACVTWPLCQGQVFPEHFLPAIHMGHRFAAAIIGALLLYTLYLGFRGRHRPLEIRLLLVGVAGLFAAQVIVGAVTIWSGFPAHLMALHLAMASAVWGVAAALALLTFTQSGSIGTTEQGAAYD